jgi:hypothetical protein
MRCSENCIALLSATTHSVAMICPSQLPAWIPVFALSLIVPVGEARATELSPSSGQLGQPLSWIDVPGSADLVHAVQLSRDGRLFLTPNESFFPKLGLTAEGSGIVPDIAELNGGKSFATIGRWDPGDIAEWGLWLKHPGTLDLTIRMSGNGGNSSFDLSVDDSSESFSISSTGEEKKTVRVDLAEAGFHRVSLTCQKGGAGAAFHWIEISGNAAADSGVVRKRWRPAAAHTKFASSRGPDHVRLWVMEMDAVPGELDFYSPITTPFGYYGPTWRADGSVSPGFNFSLWSFAIGQSEPPVEQLSHLLAIGDPKATFGGFDHEGTGVKIRDWEPLEGRQGQRQTLALRVEPGPVYDTYFSYFYASDEKRWRLFGAGNKYNKGKPLDTLWVGSFVEVPGPPPVQRSGSTERRMRYRGWVMDEQGKWYPLDRMERGNVDKETGLTHTDRGVTDDGWFYLQTGGWTFRKAPDPDPVSIAPPAGRPAVDYLDPEDIEFLKGTPSDLTTTKIERSGNRARVTFEIRNAGASPELTLYWGTAEGLTFADRWTEHLIVKDPVKDGLNQVVIEGVSTDEPLFVRALLRTAEGQFWSRETLIAKP